MNYKDLAANSIENFTINENDYFDSSQFSENINNKIYVREKCSKANIKIDFGDSIGCKVFIGKNVRGKFAISLNGDNSTIFIGNGCKLVSTQIRSLQDNDFIAIGNQVTTSSKNVWISGKAEGDYKPAIIIGDDCMFSYDIVIRNTDAHPIFNINTEEQVNQPTNIVYIEPHVWVGEQVNILKSVYIGANSVIALGSTITQDIPRFSIASGVPAKFIHKPDLYWSRGINENSKKRAKYFFYKYK